MKTLAVVLVSTLLLSDPPRNQAPTKSFVTKAQISALVQAVQDEIYDYGYEENYYQFGEEIQKDPRHYVHRVRFYVNPKIDSEGGGEAIYELLPYGEVLRSFSVRSDGMVVLDGDPEVGFPPTQPSEKTAYMKDDDVCRMKRDWIKSYFEVDASADNNMLGAASRRQKLRTGYSQWEPAQSQRKKSK